jgi:hypothetical protein
VGPWDGKKAFCIEDGCETLGVKGQTGKQNNDPQKYPDPPSGTHGDDAFHGKDTADAPESLDAERGDYPALSEWAQPGHTIFKSKSERFRE